MAGARKYIDLKQSVVLAACNYFDDFSLLNNDKNNRKTDHSLVMRPNGNELISYEGDFGCQCNECCQQLHTMRQYEFFADMSPPMKYEDISEQGEEFDEEGELISENSNSIEIGQDMVGFENHQAKKCECTVCNYTYPPNCLLYENELNNSYETIDSDLKAAAKFSVSEYKPPNQGSLRKYLV
jgi:hypothetical protein